MEMQILTMHPKGRDKRSYQVLPAFLNFEDHANVESRVRTNVVATVLRILNYSCIYRARRKSSLTVSLVDLKGHSVLVRDVRVQWGRYYGDVRKLLVSSFSLVVVDNGSSKSRIKIFLCNTKF